MTHIGSTSRRGYFDQARDHMAKVNGISIAEADNIIDEVSRRWRAQSLMSWTLAVAPDLLTRYPELEVLHRVRASRL